MRRRWSPSRRRPRRGDGRHLGRDRSRGGDLTDPAEQREFLASLGLEETGPRRGSSAPATSCSTSSPSSPPGRRRPRAWTVHRGATRAAGAPASSTPTSSAASSAPRPSPTTDFVACGGEQGAKDAGKMRSRARTTSSRTATSCTSASICRSAQSASATNSTIVPLILIGQHGHAESRGRELHALCSPDSRPHRRG